MNPPHWHREPAPATKAFAEAAPFARTPKGLQAAIDVIAYPAGHVQVVASRFSGAPGKRSIVQAGEPLMFNDIDEAKDGVDLILDRLIPKRSAPRRASELWLGRLRPDGRQRDRRR